MEDQNNNDVDPLVEGSDDPYAAEYDCCYCKCHSCMECRRMRIQSENQSCCCGIPSILGVKLIDAVIFGYAVSGIINVIFDSFNKYIDTYYNITVLFIFLPLTFCAFASFCISKS